MPKIIDTHSHVNFNAFKEDSAEVVKRALSEDIWMINVGTKYQTSRSAVEFAKNYKEGVYAVVGMHPMYAAAEFVKLKTDPDEGEFLIKEHEFNKEEYKKLAQSEKVVAIGEIGLDYYYKPKALVKLEQFKEKQKRIFQEQLDLAKELNLPVILHCRVAHDDVIDILSNYRLQTPNYNLTGVVHCFTGTKEQAQKYIDMGFYIGINGIIFKFNIDEVIKDATLDKLLFETDCPYLTPPMAESKRNEPIFIKHTIDRVSELKNISFDEVCRVTTENAKTLFGI